MIFMKMNLNKMKFKVQKHSPEILSAVGVVGVVAGGVMACKATLKLNDILDDADNQLNLIKETAADEKYAEQYSAEDAKKDTAIVYVQSGVRIIKLYLPALYIRSSLIS